MSATFPSIQEVLVSSRTRHSREAFCAQMAKEGKWSMSPVDDPLDAVRHIDLVVTSIPPSDIKPVSGKAFTPGTIFIPLDLINSWQDDVLLSADRIVADNPGHFAAQVRARRATAFPVLDTTLMIQDLVAGKAPRALQSERSVVAVCGIASTDVVVGWEIFRRAHAAGVGVDFDMQG